MKTFDEIMDLYRSRKESMGPLHDHMRQAKDHFNGDIVVPLPEMEADEKPAVANLITQGLDQTAMRVASVLPSMFFPPLQPGKDKDRGSEDWARRRQMATSGWWEQSKINLKMRRMARFVIGYATAPMIVVPDFDNGIPRYKIRNPLATYPQQNVEYEDAQPDDFIYAYTRTFGWLKNNHPEVALNFAKEFKVSPKDDHQIELIEYIDHEERVLGALGQRPQNPVNGMWIPSGYDVADWSQARGFEITRTRNRAGVCWGVSANRITIDRLMGQFSQVEGIYENQARLMALETIAVEKAIFPDLVLQGSVPGRTPLLVNGNWADGRTGEINVVRDGTVQPVQLNPGFMTQPLIDRHERNIRAAGVPAQFSGETPSNIATGRLGQNTLSATVDFPIQEYQEILADTLKEANKRAIAIAKAYFGDTQKSFHVGFNGNVGQADYKPNTHFETDAHSVRYSAPGADVNSLIIGIGQRLGLGVISRKTAMEQDPLVPDPQQEYRTVVKEKVETALLEFVAQAVVSGGMDPQDVVLLYEEVEAGTNIADAWKKAQQAAMERQARQQQEAMAAQQEAGAGQPVPEGQPGLSPPGEAPPSVEGPTPSMENLSMMLGSLRQPRPTTAPLGQQNAPRQPVG